ncbi:DUF4912 domain-containing protein [Candidatus Saganbacteria bacterium]|nr:DUF4912 domain-containing protein [Candidatus Saganbacteria bacterium]
MPPKKKAAVPKKRAVSRRPRRKKITATQDVIQPAEEKIEEAKFYTGPVMQKFEEARGFEFPGGYGDNRITIMVRDPYWIYAYWELNPGKVDQIRRDLREKFDQAKLILRIYDAGNWSFFDIGIGGGVSNWYINVGRPNTPFCVDIGFLTPDGTFIAAARSNLVTTPRDRMSDVIDEEWMIPDWERMYGLSGGFGVGKGSLEIREMIEKRMLHQVTSPGVSSLFSPTRSAQPRPFWLAANCELIVYGATEPTASVTVQGHPIKLREDGSFSLRFSLPDGRQTIPIEAVREDGAEKRQVTPIVERRTE